MEKYLEFSITYLKYCKMKRTKKGGSPLKIVFASTPEQESKIKELVSHFYENIFPKYFCDRDINKFTEMNFLKFPSHSTTGTLKESYQIISSLEIIISLIETNSLEIGRYQKMFKRNINILNELGMAMPFSYEHFTENNFDVSQEFGSIYVKAANELLV